MQEEENWFDDYADNEDDAQIDEYDITASQTTSTS